MLVRGKARTSVDIPWANLDKAYLVWGFVAPTIALLLRDETLFAAATTSNIIYIAIGGTLTAIVSSVFKLSHRVSRFFSADDTLAIVWGSALAVFSTAALCFLLTRLDEIPRSVVVLHFLILCSGNIFVRVHRFTRRRSRVNRTLPLLGMENIIVVGVSDLASYYIQIVENLMSDMYNIVAVLDEEKRLQGRYVHGYPIAGRVSDIELVLSEYELHGITIHHIVLAIDGDGLSKESTSALQKAQAKRALFVTLLPKRLGLARGTEAQNILDREKLTPNKFSKLDSSFWRWKRVLDVISSAIALMVLLPLVIVLYLIVLLDCGAPALFWQIRVGKHGRKFPVYKFRTLLALYDQRGNRLTDVERVSKIGAFLRASRLDELPQLISVLRGEMSLIGPRPLLPADLSDDVGLRLYVRPGITGWAQINGATLVTPDEKNALDEWYIRHASWKLELAIILGTVRAIVRPSCRNEKAISEALLEKRNVDDGRGEPPERV